jgi:hypothetical protein
MLPCACIGGMTSRAFLETCKTKHTSQQPRVCLAGMLQVAVQIPGRKRVEVMEGFPFQVRCKLESKGAGSCSKPCLNRQAAALRGTAQNARRGAPTPRSQAVLGSKRAKVPQTGKREDWMERHPTQTTKKLTTHYCDSKNSRGGLWGAGPPLME